MKHTWLACVLALAVSPFAAAQVAPAPTLVDTLKSAGKFQTYLELQEIAGFRDLGLGPVAPVSLKNKTVAAIAAPAPRTFLVPNDDAFRALPKGALQALKDDPKRLRAFLLLHSLPGTVMVGDMFLPVAESRKQFVSVQGRGIEITCSSHAGMHHPRLAVAGAPADAQVAPRKAGSKAGIQDDGLHAGMGVNAGRARVGMFQDVVVAEGVVHEIDAVLLVDGIE